MFERGGSPRRNARSLGLFVRWRCVLYINRYDTVYLNGNMIGMGNLPASDMHDHVRCEYVTKIRQLESTNHFLNPRLTRFMHEDSFEATILRRLQTHGSTPPDRPFCACIVLNRAEVRQIALRSSRNYICAE